MSSHRWCRRLWTARTTRSMERAYLLSPMFLRPGETRGLQHQTSVLRHHIQLGETRRPLHRLCAESTESILHSPFPVDCASGLFATVVPRSYEKNDNVLM
jgi:hypothetical protein